MSALCAECVRDGNGAFREEAKVVDRRKCLEEDTLGGWFRGASQMRRLIKEGDRTRNNSWTSR